MIPIILKSTVFKVNTRNGILSFFLLFVMSSKFEKKLFDVVILLINIFGDNRRSIKLPKKKSGSIRRNCATKVYFSSTALPKIEVKKNPKNAQNLKKIEFHSPISWISSIGQPAGTPEGGPNLPKVSSTWIKIFWFKITVNLSQKKSSPKKKNDHFWQFFWGGG